MDRRSLHHVPAISKMVSKNSWLVIFGDLLALMVTFFVLMFSMTGVDQGKWQNLQKSLKEGLNPAPIIKTVNPEQKADMALSRPVGTSLDYLKTVLEGKALQDPAFQNLSVERVGNDLVMRLYLSRFFLEGDKGLSLSGRRVLESLAEILQALPNEVALIGHVDVRPVFGQLAWSSKRDKSLWMAARVKQVFVASGYQYPIKSIGAGDQYFQELDATLDPAMLYDKANRVDVIIKEQQRNDDVSAFYKQ